MRFELGCASPPLTECLVIDWIRRPEAAADDSGDAGKLRVVDPPVDSPVSGVQVVGLYGHYSPVLEHACVTDFTVDQQDRDNLTGCLGHGWIFGELSDQLLCFFFEVLIVDWYEQAV